MMKTIFALLFLNSVQILNSQIARENLNDKNLLKEFNIKLESEYIDTSSPQVKSIQVTIYPNPSNGIFFINVFPNNIETTIEIINSSGKMVKSVKENFAQQIVGGTGMYFVRVIPINSILKEYTQKILIVE